MYLAFHKMTTSSNQICHYPYKNIKNYTKVRYLVTMIIKPAFIFVSSQRRFFSDQFSIFNSFNHNTNPWFSNCSILISFLFHKQTKNATINTTLNQDEKVYWFLLIRYKSQVTLYYTIPIEMHLQLKIMIKQKSQYNEFRERSYKISTSKPKYDSIQLNAMISCFVVIILSVYWMLKLRVDWKLFWFNCQIPGADITPYPKKTQILLNGYLKGGAIWAGFKGWW